MIEVEREMEAAANRLKERSPEEIGRVTRNRHIMQNAPIIAGARVPTSAIWSFHEEGYDAEAIIKEYPQLTPEDIEAAIDFEAKMHMRQAG